MHGVETQAVDVVVVEPHPDVVEDEPAHLRRALAVEVDQVAPRVAAGLEVRPELRQVVPRRPQVVVDDVLDDAEAGLVAAVHEPLVAGRAAVRLVDRVPQHAVVAPVVHAAHRVDRHQLDEVDAERAQVVEAPERRVERAFGSEGADVELVDHRAAQLPTRPALVVPVVGRGVESSRALVDARRLTPRPRIGSGRVRVVDQVAVVGLLARCRGQGLRGSTSRRPRVSSRRWHRPPTAGPVCARGAHTSYGICGDSRHRSVPHQQRNRQLRQQ